MTVVRSSVVGAPEKIASIRNRHSQVIDSVARYEEKIARQAAQLERMNRPQSAGGYYDEETDEAVGQKDGVETNEMVATEEDLQREQEEIRELEMRKKALETRVSGMEKDLGGLLR